MLEHAHITPPPSNRPPPSPHSIRRRTAKPSPWTMDHPPRILVSHCGPPRSQRDCWRKAAPLTIYAPETLPALRIEPRSRPSARSRASLPPLRPSLRSLPPFRPPPILPRPPPAPSSSARASAAAVPVSAVACHSCVCYAHREPLSHAAEIVCG